MPKLPKILLLPVIIIAIVIGFNILLPVCLAQLDFLDLQVPFGDLPAKLAITGSTMGEYVKAVFLFGSATVIVLAIIMIMYGGVLWTISGAAPSNIEKAKDSIFKAILGMCIALFAIIILQVVAPGTIVLQPLSITKIEGMPCCQTGEKQYEFLLKTECDAKKGKLVSPGLCVGELRVLDLENNTTCTDDLTKKCGEAYEDSFKTKCTGKDCSALGATKVCKDNAGTFECVECTKTGEACTADNLCCGAKCTDGKCVDITGALFKSCDDKTEQKDCQGLKCYAPSLGLNKCQFGYVGNPCVGTDFQKCLGGASLDTIISCYNANADADKDCAADKGYYCNTSVGTIGTNKCMPKIGYGRCDPYRMSSTTCPGGFTCGLASSLVTAYAKLPAKAVTGLAGLAVGVVMDKITGVKELTYCNKADGYGCLNEPPASGHIQFPGATVCTPSNQTKGDKLCVCYCNSSDQCPKAPNGDPMICNTSLGNYCTTGDSGTSCNSNAECKTKMCSTAGANTCARGEIGDSCSRVGNAVLTSGDGECRAGLKCYAPTSGWLSNQGTCVPGTAEFPWLK
ncbi:MAG: pilin [Candidatus Parcubacteria bacterium]|nr:pilin [Candidatus Parcubacteria bacterium]